MEFSTVVPSIVGEKERIDCDVIKWSNVDSFTIENELNALVIKNEEKKWLVLIFSKMLKHGVFDDETCIKGDFWKEPAIARDKIVIFNIEKWIINWNIYLNSQK